jgi:hypothetical protein
MLALFGLSPHVALARVEVEGGDRVKRSLLNCHSRALVYVFHF